MRRLLVPIAVVLFALAAIFGDLSIESYAIDSLSLIAAGLAVWAASQL